MMDFIVCHYAEIGLKGRNRKFFEERLVDNIKRNLNSDDFEFVKRISGRVIIKLSARGASGARKEHITTALQKTFGVAGFAFAMSCPQSIDAISEIALKLLSAGKPKTFRIDAKRSEKNFFLTSRQINEKAGEYVLKNLQTRVDLNNPEATCFIEVVESYGLLYAEKISGPGGLPVGVSGKAVVLLSGGIDSPVAGWYAMKRGITAVFVHFHAYPYVSKASIEKTKQLAEILAKHQGEVKLYLVPFGEIQKEILLKTPEKFRVILYRRFMVRIAEALAKKERAKVLVTGESVGQVASQTIENIGAIEAVAGMPILRPLVGFDKQEIVDIAKKIGTFDVSILPDQDCCSRFVPKHPATKADLARVENAENGIAVDELVAKALKSAEALEFKPPPR
ncbi:MAG: tRNA 4-thiouridine(8) synthase ThiI [Candidatus Wildermuthbacteria bacterium RIFCSPLOWO2_02_FULL_47_10]|nr:MAG: tRNA 4-thiouridine(8) synthase ThiI [Candidatus Wildermuthbacteria bacterium RIFCSPLOWO2_02_FULL_47_10]